MGSLITDAETLAARVRVAAKVRATHDPAVANTNRPCVLVAPPTIDYARRTNTWSVVLLASKPTGSLAALAELDQLLQAVVPVLDVETATPASYALTPETGTTPAYVLRVTT